MQLQELLPDQPEFFLTSKQKTYRLRIPNLEDRARFSEWLGDQATVKKVFEELQWPVLSKLVYRLMADKSDFPATTVTEINDDGVEEARLVSGPQMLLRSVTSIDESMKMLGALTTALRMGDPLVDEAVRQAVAEKKSQ